MEGRQKRNIDAKPPPKRASRKVSAAGTAPEAADETAGDAPGGATPPPAPAQSPKEVPKAPKPAGKQPVIEKKKAIARWHENERFVRSKSSNRLCPLTP